MRASETRSGAKRLYAHPHPEQGLSEAMWRATRAIHRYASHGQTARAQAWSIAYSRLVQALLARRYRVTS